MIPAIITSALFGIINYVRGRGMIPYAGHVVASLAWGLVVAAISPLYGFPLHYSIAIGITTFIGMLIWMVGVVPGWGGWGLYFASWTWVWNPNEKEVKPIDWIGKKLVPFKTMAPHWTNGLRGTICMGLRGLYITPLFFMLEALPLGIAVGLMQGIVYGSMHWLAPAGKGTEYAEPVYAAIVGLAIAHTMQVGY